MKEEIQKKMAIILIGLVIFVLGVAVGKIFGC